MLHSLHGSVSDPGESAGCVTYLSSGSGIDSELEEDRVVADLRVHPRPLDIYYLWVFFRSVLFNILTPQAMGEHRDSTSKISPRFLQDVPVDRLGPLVSQYGEIWGSTTGLVGANPTIPPFLWHGSSGVCNRKGRELFQATEFVIDIRLPSASALPPPKTQPRGF